MVIGTLRSVMELSLDNPPVTSYTDYYLDIVTLLVFVYGLVLVLMNGSDVWIRWTFFVPLVILICISLFVYEGLAGTSELTVYGLVVIMNLTMRNKTLIFFNLLLLLGVGVSLAFVERLYPLKTLVVLDEDPMTFLFISLALILLVNIAKNSFDRKRKELSSLNLSLATKHASLEKGNIGLEEQNADLTALKDELEQKVLERSKSLQKQNEAIDAYMHLTLNELVKPYQKTLLEIQKIEPEDSAIASMLVDSGKRLKVEMEKLTKRLQDG